MVSSERPPNNELNRLLRKMYNPIGFTRFYNFVLWFIFSGALLGFCLARSAYMNYGIYCHFPPYTNLAAAPGECATYKGHYRVGITMHLVTIIPAGFLVLFQFVPVIRHKVILFHRINGYIVITLVLVSNAAALMIVRKAFGGTLSTQAGVGVLAIGSTLAFALAWINIKRVQIDQHRKWMMRAWFWMASIITLRLILLCAGPIITDIGSYYYSMPCEKIVGLYQEYHIPEQAVLGQYPNCLTYLNGTDPNAHASVHATANGLPEQAAAVLDMSFGMCLWLALALHVIGLEIYFHFTPREHARLRQVSYERQLERGFSHPGSAGLTSDRLGDAEPFVPMANQHGSHAIEAPVLHKPLI